MLTIYGNKISGSCAKVVYVARLLKIPYEFREMDPKKDLQTPEYLRLHPVGKIPAMDDDGFTLFESGAIIRYLCDKYGSDLYPRDIKKRAIVDQWTDFCVCHVGPALHKIVMNKVFAPMRGLPVDQAELEKGYKECERFLPAIENQLEKCRFLAGDKMTLADINLLTALFYAEKSDFSLAEYRHTDKWRQGMLKVQDFQIE